MLSMALQKYKSKISNTKQVTKEDKPDKDSVNILSSMNYSSIMHTNKKYNERVHKPMANCVEQTFANREEFNEYIEEGIESMCTRVNWKQMPVMLKARLCKKYILEDSTLSTEQQKTYIDEMTTTTLFDHVKYDKQTKCVKSIEYALIEPIVYRTNDLYLNDMLSD